MRRRPTSRHLDTILRRCSSAAKAGLPSANSAVIATLNPTAKQVAVYGVQKRSNPGQWVQVNYYGQEGWVLGNFLTDHHKASWRTFSVAGLSSQDFLSIRDAPNTNGTIIAKIPSTTTNILHSGRFSGPVPQRWVEVIFDRKIGWVNGRFLAETKERLHLGQSGFFGDISLSPLSDGIKMETRTRFGYIDQSGRIWEVPANFKTDGASVPRALWSIICSPFTGKYRNAAILHDRYCETRARSWQDTHRLFYEVMVASGVEQTQATLMYAAVVDLAHAGLTISPPNVGILAPLGPYIFEATVYPIFTEEKWRRLSSEVTHERTA